jgi:hypothetical protein
LCDKEVARLRDMGGEKLEVIPRDGLCQRMRDDA